MDGNGSGQCLAEGDCDKLSLIRMTLLANDKYSPYDISLILIMILCFLSEPHP